MKILFHNGTHRLKGLQVFAVATSLLLLPALGSAESGTLAERLGLAARAGVVEAAGAPRETPGERLVYTVAPVHEDAIAWAAEDGLALAVVRYRLQGAAGVRIHFEDFALKDGERVFVSGGGRTDGPFTGTGPLRIGEFWTQALPGDEVVVEWQTAHEDPGVLPFVVREVADSTPGGWQPTEPAPQPETVVSFYQGVPVAHEVVDGLAIVEGDIVLGRADSLVRAAPGVRGERFTRGLGISHQSRLWPGGVVPYTVAPDAPNQSRILAAVSHWNQQLAGVISLEERKNESVYLTFVKASSASTCASYIGRLGMAGQPVFVGSNCSTGNIIHEVGHAIGLYHEHVREDRDDKVSIQWENITSGAEHNFQQDVTNSSDLGSYDYGSIMHYGAYAFSRNGLRTIVTKPSGISIGQRTALSSGDVEATQIMYPAQSTSPPATVNVTLATNPTGRQVTVDGVTYATPRTFAWTPGTSHNVSVEDATVNGSQYTFHSWSDGGERSHTYFVPASNATLIATYNVLHQVSSKSASGGTVSQSPQPSGEYLLDGASVSFAAAASDGACFTGWSGSASGMQNPLSTTVKQPLSVTANFGAGSVTVAPAQLDLPKGKTSVDLAVTGTGGCPWRASNNDSWIKLSSGSGTGDAIISVSVNPNNQKGSRTGMIVIGDVTVRVTQAGR